MYKHPASANQKGFTLIEMMAMMVIIGVLTSVAVKKMINIEATATIQAIQNGIGELNVRETLTWTNEIFGSGDFPGDSAVWTAMSANLNVGNPYTWSAAPDITGGTLVFGGYSIALSRTASTAVTSARWNEP
jgi:prepilin-type N-terminal cleavage/methylation domain-containing protein